MLHEFVSANRAEIIERCRAKIAIRLAPRPTEDELEHGVPLLLDQLVDTLRLAEHDSAAIAKSAAKYAGELLHAGFTIAQVVQDYRGVCQAINELAVETTALIPLVELKTLNQCLDEATAQAVTEYARLREHEGTERVGRLVHEIRGLLHSATLAFEMVKSGDFGIGGSTGAVLGRSLASLANLVDRELTEVRLAANVVHKEVIDVRNFVEDLEVAAVLDANARQLRFSMDSGDFGVKVNADREILASVVTNLLRNAFKFTHSGGHVTLRTHATSNRVHIEVQDQCGGLPPGKVGELFQPFEQRSEDRSGLGLGLSICQRGAAVNDGAIQVRDIAGVGCVFAVDLPRQLQTLPS